jgi:hypothetical protein
MWKAINEDLGIVKKDKNSSSVFFSCIIMISNNELKKDSKKKLRYKFIRFGNVSS